MKSITIEYPTEEKFISHTNRILAKIHNRAPAFVMVPVNQEYTIEVKVKTPTHMSLDEACMHLTGMTPAQYQTRFGVAWNE